MNKTFACGHTGKGQFCHRCAQAEKEKSVKLQQQQAAVLKKKSWQAQIQAAPISLNHLPKDISSKALQMIEALNSGKSYLEFKGKRLAAMGLRHIISTPLGLSHRLVCREENGRLSYLEAIPHEEYNNRLAIGGWK